MKSFEARGLEKDMHRVKQISNLVKKKILESNPKYEEKIEKLSEAELEDLARILSIVEQILIRHQHKKEAYAILKEFSDLTKSWGFSLMEINDQIHELLISVQNSVTEIKSTQNDVSSRLSIEHDKKQTLASDCGRINLTNSATAVYPPEYQQTQQVKFEQVI
jgi:DUF1009 family protein